MPPEARYAPPDIHDADQALCRPGFRRHAGLTATLMRERLLERRLPLPE